MDPLAKMLCSMLKIQPEQLQQTVAQIAQAGTYFKAKIDDIDAHMSGAKVPPWAAQIIQEQAALRALIERNVANVGAHDGSREAGDNRSGCGSALVAAE